MLKQCKMSEIKRLRKLPFLEILSVSFPLISLREILKFHKAYLNIFFIKKIKQFSKVDIKQNNVSTVILFKKFLVYQWDPCHLHCYICVYVTKSVFYVNLSNFVHIILSDVHKDLSGLRIKYWNQKYKSRTSLLYGEIIGEASF